MKVSTDIAKAFMMGGKGSGASRITGWIAIIGMAVGCFVLILSVAILNGFEERVTEKIIGFEGDVRITGNLTPEGVTRISDITGSNPAIIMQMPFKERPGIIYNPQKAPKMVRIKAFDTETLDTFYDLSMVESSLSSDLTNVYIGRSLADRLNIDLDDVVVLVSPMDNMGFPSIGGRIQGRIKGIFRAGVLDFDDTRVFISEKAANILFSRKKTFDGIDLKIQTEARPEEIVSLFMSSNIQGIKAESWNSMHQNLFNAMKLEKIGAVIVLSLIILVAAFNLTSTLVLVTFQKIREIAILRTVGASESLIRNIILKQGGIIGGVGALIGTATGLLIVVLQNKFGILPLPEDIYMINQIPMILYLRDIVLISGIALIMIAVSSWMASKRAVKIDPKHGLTLEK